MDRAEDLILLVGSNPVPNYVAVALLKPARVYLVYSRQTERVYERLKRCLEDKLKIQTFPRKVADAFRKRDIQMLARDLPGGAALHYTGGTKPMSTHLHAVWFSELGGREDWASYLDDGGDRLLLDNGEEYSLTSSWSLDLETLAHLHGFDSPKPRSPVPGGPSAGDAAAVALAVAADPALAAMLYGALTVDEKPLPWAEFKCRPLQQAQFGLGLTQDPVPGPDWPRKRVEAWLEFLRGGWLEVWAAETVREVLRASSASVDVGVHLTGGGRQFELDVLAIRGHRLYGLSCTTALDHKLCKSKLFEVALRTRQLGGDLSRFAFVCLLDKDGKGNDWADVLQDQVGSAWDAPSKPQVFGLKHGRAWLGHRGGIPDRNSLVDWLAS